MATFAANVPVSEPKKNSQFNAEVDFGGMAWDSINGIFIPISQEIDRMEAPQPPVQVPRRK